ncbi:MAG: class II fructose-bisphosphate aldolase [Lentisphaeria bacterium]|nr:class II fructose-bisphosphate aldolase [Lentisphaeria bacterium]
MSLQRMDTLMRRAREQKIAIGAFECWESLNIQAIAKAAAYCRKPVIFQASPAEYNTMGGADALACMVKFYVDKYNVDAALHLDHGSTLEHVEECVKSGFTSVMLDASAEVFAENVRLSAAAAEIAHSANCSLEAELGHVTGGDGGDAESALTVPEEVVEFVKQTQVDCLAVSIGTVHGDYRGKPELRLDLLKKITELTDIPLVLHGGSGTPIDQLHGAIKLGIAKINICTDIHKAFLSGIEDARVTLTPSVPGKFYEPACEKIFAKTVEMIELFSNIK